MTTPIRRNAMTKAARDARAEHILALRAAGKPSREIAADTGYDLQAVYREIRKASPTFKTSFPDTRANHVGKIGSVKAELLNETEAFRQWLRANLPDDTSVSAFLISIAVDTFNDEQFNNN